MTRLINFTLISNLTRQPTSQTRCALPTRFLDYISESSAYQTGDCSQVGEHLSAKADGQTSIDVYSVLPPENKAGRFPLPDSIPAFIRAGWDSCSDLSDS